MKTTHLRSLVTLLIAACLWGAERAAVAQTGVPVYKVVSSGASAAQARTLADMLQVPFDRLSVSNGQIFFLSPSNYMAVPTAPVTDPAIIRDLLAQTENPFPNIPIRFEKIDFDALARLAVPSEDLVLRLAGDAFGQSGLSSQFGNPVIGHTMLNAFYLAENNVVISNRHALDTKINYAFVTPEGHRLIGPGAQVQLTYGPNGQVNHLLYAARTLQASEVVPVISSAEAIRRAAGMFPQGANITAELVYWCPPFWQPSPARWEIMNIVPSYLLTAKSDVTDPSGKVTELEALTQVIPATDVAAYVPAVGLEASVQNGTQILATANVTGGQPPYTFQWSGSDPNLAFSNGPSVLYTPQMIVGVPPLSVRTERGKLVISWPHDPASAPALNLESTPVLDRAAWKQITPPITTNSWASVSLDFAGSGAMFFRLHLSEQPVLKLETVSVKVTDANGVGVEAAQTLQLGVLPAPRPTPSKFAPKVVGISDWGTESPYDTELGWNDRLGWTTGMILGGAGTQRFRWLDKNAWKIDFQEAPAGDDDAMLDNADIVLYIGHGNPEVITFTGGPSLHPHELFYNEASQSWGDWDEEWLCFLSCSVLKFDDAAGDVWHRWGPNFDGLHVLTGFSTGAGAMTGFPFTFAQNMLGGFWFFGNSPSPIVNSWFAAAYAHGTGSPVAMGPIGPGGVWDLGDYYWGRGPVGPTIRASQIRGWWYAY